MIFRISQKIGKKIGISPSTCLPMDDNPYLDWSAHIFSAERTQYILITNTSSLYSLIIYGKGINSDNKFLQMAFSEMRELMADDNNQFLFERLIAPNTGKVSFSKSGDKRVIGSMNDLIHHAKYYLTEGNLSPYDVTLRLNEILMSYLKYNSPRNAFKTLKV